MIAGISSMATSRLLAELCAASEARMRLRASVESVGGVVVARRIAAGEAFDFVVLAEEAIDALAHNGHVDASTIVTIARSEMAMAVESGVAPPRIDTAEDVRDALLTAPRIVISTGPSGKHLLGLIERWGIAACVTPRLVQAPPGVGVASLLAHGHAAIGFQQMSELLGVASVTIAGPLPAEIQATTRFCGAVCTVSAQPAMTRQLLTWMASGENEAMRSRWGLST